MQNKEQRPRIVIGVFIIVLGVLALIHDMVTQDVAAWLWIGGLALSAVVFGWAFTYAREAWAAVGAYVTGAIALLILLIEKLNIVDAWIPVVVLVGIAIPFVVGWWVNRTQWGFLIPAYVMVAIIPVLFLDEIASLRPEIMTAYILLAVALPFWIAYVFTRKLWALVPGGILLLLSIAFVSVGFGLPSQILTILLPLLLIVAGIYLLFRSGSGLHQQQ